MPWKNQGGGPWGSGPKGPWGSGPQPVGPRPPDLEDLLRRGQDRLQQLLPGGYFSGLGIALDRARRARDLGDVRLLPRAVRGARHRAALRQICARCPARACVTTCLIRSRPCCCRRRCASSTISIGMTLIDDPTRRGRTMRDVPEESLMLTGDENIVDVDFTVLWRIKPKGAADYPVQHPESRRHREGGRRKRDARGDRPLQHPADPDRRAHQHRAGRAATDAEDARRLRLGHPDRAGADAEGRSAGAGDRRLPRRAGRARRSRAAAERGADLRQPHRARGQGPRRADLPGRRGLQAAGGRRSQGPERALPEGL